MGVRSYAAVCWCGFATWVLEGEEEGGERVACVVLSWGGLLACLFACSPK